MGHRLSTLAVAFFLAGALGWTLVCGCEKQKPKSPPTKPAAESRPAAGSGREASRGPREAKRETTREASEADRGGKREAAHPPKERAASSVRPTKPFDILTASVISVDRDLSKAAREGKKAIYELIRSGDGPGSVSLPETHYQKVKKLSERRFRVTVIRPDRDRLPKASLSRQGSERKQLAPYLRPTMTLQANAPLIRKLATKAVQGTQDAMTAAKRLEKLVDERINLKGYSVPAATALDAARMRKGDCSEHAYLLAALARAVGLPSRVASGVLFAARFQKKSNVFVYHMWTEIRIGDRWVPFDGTRPQQAGSVTHILLATDPMTSMLPVQGTMALMRLIGQLEIEVDSITY